MINIVFINIDYILYIVNIVYIINIVNNFLPFNTIYLNYKYIGDLKTKIENPSLYVSKTSISLNRVNKLIKL